MTLEVRDGDQLSGAEITSHTNLLEYIPLLSLKARTQFTGVTDVELSFYNPSPVGHGIIL
jgi:hypothetical protein